MKLNVEYVLLVACFQTTFVMSHHKHEGMSQQAILNKMSKILWLVLAYMSSLKFDWNPNIPSTTLLMLTLILVYAVYSGSM